MRCHRRGVPGEVSQVRVSQVTMSVLGASLAEAVVEEASWSLCAAETLLTWGPALSSCCW